MNRRPIGVLPFFFALALTGCNNDNVPAGYIGFEKGTAEWVYDKSKNDRRIFTQDCNRYQSR